jgi:hypothetical protein
MNLLNPFEGNLEKGVRKAAHPWGGLNSSKVTPPERLAASPP